MIATSMTLLQHVCFVPLARAVRTRSRSLATNLVMCHSNISTVTAPSSSPSRVSTADSRVLLGLSESELQQLALDFGQERFRGKQLHHLIYKRKVKDVDEFTYLPQTFRTELQEAGWKVGRSPIYDTVTAADGTIKLLLKLEDSRLIETVGIPVEDDNGAVRLTACVSSQVLAIEDIFKNRVTNVVFMGMGEPMLNLKSVLEAHRCLNKDVEIGQRMITISTVGVPNTIKSLHAPNQKLRESIVPSAKAYPLTALMEDCKDYFTETKRRVSFEYALLAGVNDAVEHATELAELLHNWARGSHVNLIPFNPIEGSTYQRPSKKATLAFKSALESHKITVSIRQTRGLEANAACGQLRNKFQKSPLLLDSDDVQSQSDVAVAC